ncbi:cytochrome P450 [Nocardioides sp. R-C-SC26]|uniref:cytochrome P450 n=1 Tax=Nocardioides sp. R-C-SC26 TaxID=2870414 RepID=UPI001E3CAEFA|nr:cytochrome P450 [Nocardioides sp. R-C-SC26]
MTLLEPGHAASSWALDPYDYDFQEDPYPAYARLRAEAPLYYNAEQDFWALSRHADVVAAFRDDSTYSNAMGVSVDKSAWGPDAHKVMSFLGLDGQRQQRLRSLVSRAFTPRRVRELAPRVQELTDHYFDLVLEGDGEFDWIAEFAGKLPMDVISEMMGVPVEDRAEVRRQADLVVHREEGIRDVPPAAMESSLWLVGYYADMLEQRKRRRTDDLTSALLDAEIDGDKLLDQEIIAFLFLMVVAGNETTTKLLGNALFHLAANPEQLRQVLASPDDVSLVTPWIEETLRHDTSSQMLARHLLKDVEVEGVVAPADSKMLLIIGSANRDERVFTDPARFDIGRPKEELSQIVSFGGGRHFCLGANLARLEARIVLEEMVRRVRHLEVDATTARRVHSVSVRGFAGLDVTMATR